MSSELHLQEKFLIPFFLENLGYKEVKANTVNPSTLIIEEDLEEFISNTELNRIPYQALLKKYKNDRRQLLVDLITLIQDRASSSRNMAKKPLVALVMLKAARAARAEMNVVRITSGKLSPSVPM